MTQLLNPKNNYTIVTEVKEEHLASDFEAF
jgi:hypothetical protein